MTTPSEIHFEDPTPNKRRSGRVSSHIGFAAELKKREGQWAVVARYGKESSARCCASRIRGGGIAEYRPTEDYEALCLLDAEKGDWVVYVRYTPGRE